MHSYILPVRILTLGKNMMGKIRTRIFSFLSLLINKTSRQNNTISKKKFQSIEMNGYSRLYREKMQKHDELNIPTAPVPLFEVTSKWKGNMGDPNQACAYGTCQRL